VQQVGDEPGEAGIQLARRDVDRDVLEIESFAAPGDELAECRAQRLAADLLDQAADSANATVAGRDQPARRMAPADQRLGRRCVRSRHLELRLV
jgi:hypothetical protein